jgi:FKBP-type peptidyl-prolyl cis-trans isomerase SlyD
MIIREKCVVSFNYKLTGESGDLLDESKGNPLTYLHSSGSLIAGLERALEGKTPGDTLHVVLPPEQAYGQVLPQLIQDVPREMFKGVDNLEPGMEFETRGEGDHVMLVRIDQVGDEEVRVNGNHPLAGKTLIFDVEVVDVRQATDEELSHGHSHEGGGHHH